MRLHTHRVLDNEQAVLVQAVCNCLALCLQLCATLGCSQIQCTSNRYEVQERKPRVNCQQFPKNKKSFPHSYIHESAELRYASRSNTGNPAKASSAATLDSEHHVTAHTVKPRTIPWTAIPIKHTSLSRIRFGVTATARARLCLRKGKIDD